MIDIKKYLRTIYRLSPILVAGLTFFLENSALGEEWVSDTGKSQPCEYWTSDLWCEVAPNPMDLIEPSYFDSVFSTCSSSSYLEKACLFFETVKPENRERDAFILEDNFETEIKKNTPYGKCALGLKDAMNELSIPSKDYRFIISFDALDREKTLKTPSFQRIYSDKITIKIAHPISGTDEAFYRESIQVPISENMNCYKDALIAIEKIKNKIGVLPLRLRKEKNGNGFGYY